jgi:hypothetical protein
MRKTSIEIHPILLILVPKHGHQELFNSLQVFIQQFLKGKLSFLTFLLYDQLSNHRFYYHHQIEIQIPKPNEYITINKRNSKVLDQKRYQIELLNNLTTITRELDKGRGARTTSKKPYQRWYRLLCASIVKRLQEHFKLKRTKQMNRISIALIYVENLC